MRIVFKLPAPLDGSKLNQENDASWNGCMVLNAFTCLNENKMCSRTCQLQISPKPQISKVSRNCHYKDIHVCIGLVKL